VTGRIKDGRHLHGSRQGAVSSKPVFASDNNIRLTIRFPFPKPVFREVEGGAVALDYPRLGVVAP
jgi:hypothetical protein